MGGSPLVVIAVDIGSTQAATLLRNVDQEGVPARILLLGAYGTLSVGGPDSADLAAAALGMWGPRVLRLATHLVAAGMSQRHTPGPFPRSQVIALQIDREGRANWYAIPPTPQVHYGGRFQNLRYALNNTTPREANPGVVAAIQRMRNT